MAKLFSEIVNKEGEQRIFGKVNEFNLDGVTIKQRGITNKSIWR